jgi:hypothetical protein
LDVPSVYGVQIRRHIAPELVASGLEATTHEDVARAILGRSNDCLSVLEKGSPVMGLLVLSDAVYDTPQDRRIFSMGR